MTQRHLLHPVVLSLGSTTFRFQSLKPKQLIRKTAAMAANHADQAGEQVKGETVVDTESSAGSKRQNACAFSKHISTYRH